MKQYEVTFSYTMFVLANSYEEALEDGRFAYESKRPQIMELKPEVKELV